MSKAPDWSTGLHGCLDIKTESLLDPWNYTPCVSDELAHACPAKSPCVTRPTHFELSLLRSLAYAVPVTTRIFGRCSLRPPPGEPLLHLVWN